MKKSSLVVVSLLTISVFSALNGSWLLRYFQTPTESADDKVVNAYLLEFAPFSDRKLIEYQKFLYPEDREKFINQKLNSLYDLHSKTPGLFTQKNLERIIEKIKAAYQNATENALIEFSPILNRFIIYEYNEDTTNKRKVIQKLEKTQKIFDAECNEIRQKANEACRKLKKMLLEI